MHAHLLEHTLRWIFARMCVHLLTACRSQLNDMLTICFLTYSWQGKVLIWGSYLCAIPINK